MITLKIGGKYRVDMTKGFAAAVSGFGSTKGTVDVSLISPLAISGYSQSGAKTGAGPDIWRFTAARTEIEHVYQGAINVTLTSGGAWAFSFFTPNQLSSTDPFSRMRFDLRISGGINLLPVLSMSAAEASQYVRSKLLTHALEIRDGSKGSRLAGMDRADEIYGNGGNDTLSGGGGNDTLNGGTGADSMIGGAGNDLFYIDSASDLARERAGGGIDTVHSSIETYKLKANLDNVVLFGGALHAVGNGLANVMQGNGQANNLAGAAGDDTLAGASGNDTLDGGRGMDSIDGGAGDDIIAWDADDVRVDGGLGMDTLVAGAGDLDLTGDAGAKIFGVEVIDLTGSGANALTLTDVLVAALSETDTLTVLGDAEDVVNAIGFAEGGDAPDGFVSYTGGGATLLVEEGVTVFTS